tara:strand:+ start:1247 stop:1846 length:600 start_codon:yes stop_codon:yes gene_type:complete
MYKIGITGGIASGKTTAAIFFQDKGAFIFNADQEAKSIIISDKTVQNKIIKYYGNQVITKNNLDLKKLGKVAFNSKINQKFLNNLIWPILKLIIKKKMNIAEINNKNIFVVDAALLIEANFIELFDHILLISTTEKNRIERALKRKIISKNEIKKRISLQMKDEEKENNVNYTIYNNGSEEDYYESLENYFNKYFSDLI